MPYITRNKEGKIVAIHQNKSDDGRLWEEASHPDVMAFTGNMETSLKAKQALTGSDHEMVRVIEDLIDLLMEKQIFVYTELPEAVQAKLNERKQLRQDMSSLENLINEDDDNIF